MKREEAFLAGIAGLVDGAAERQGIGGFPKPKLQSLDFFELPKAFPALIVQTPKDDDFVPLNGRWKLFKRAIQRCITLAPYEYSDQLESRMALDSQSFQKVKILAV